MELLASPEHPRYPGKMLASIIRGRRIRTKKLFSAPHRTEQIDKCCASSWVRSCLCLSCTSFLMEQTYKHIGFPSRSWIIYLKSCFVSSSAGVRWGVVIVKRQDLPSFSQILQPQGQQTAWHHWAPATRSQDTQASSPEFSKGNYFYCILSFGRFYFV